MYPFRTSEMESSESQVGNGSSASTEKSTRVQRVTPTKRETTTSTSSSSSSSTPVVVRPVVRQILSQLTPNPRSPRTPTRTPILGTPTRTPSQQVMARNVLARPTSLNRSTRSRSPQTPVTVSGVNYLLIELFPISANFHHPPFTTSSSYPDTTKPANGNNAKPSDWSSFRFAACTNSIGSVQENDV